MSSSPPAAPPQSTKRPLEDPSSPSAPNDQPEAKRPALDKVLKNNDGDDVTTAAEEGGSELPAVGVADDAKIEPTNGIKNNTKDDQGDILVTDAPGSREVPQSIESTGVAGTQSNTGSALQHDESGWIHVRAVITSAEAATIIGKGGENVSLIRKISGAKCTVSDYQKGAVERILTVSGVVDAAAKVCWLHDRDRVHCSLFIGVWSHNPDT
jgi:heterogeneous nuclear rnp K-like protein 2